MFIHIYMCKVYNTYAVNLFCVMLFANTYSTKVCYNVKMKGIILRPWKDVALKSHN